jgi:hypothetical protein
MGTIVDLAECSGRSGTRTQTARLTAEMTALREEGRRKMGADALEKARAQTQPVISARWEQIFQELFAAKSTR